MLRALFLLLLFTVGDQGFAQALTPVTIRTADGRAVELKVELALTPEQSERGLMYRLSMPPDQGMLFDFHEEKEVFMWMKNTVLPLDMIFLKGDGSVAGIAKRAVPFSTEIISSPGKVRGVLEVNGGTADRLRIAVGDHVDNPLFGKN